jgi:17beta-estradiol 17-dehydrogenase / very-long-chain 3-oxoacyl-CoA reductase
VERLENPITMEAVLDMINETNPIVVVAAAVGCLCVGKFTLKATGAIYKTFLRPAKDPKKLGQWAVVTGATDGIGKAYSVAFAKKGMNVMLISRTEAKLEAVKKEIDEKNYGVETKYVVCDYSKFDDKSRDTVFQAIKDLDIGVLINNVGVSYRYPVFFHELSNDEIINLMEMNVNSTTWMTKFVIDGMIERKRGCIVNLSSGSAMYTLPLLAEYSAAKSYIEKFSRALNAEYNAKGVTCQCQNPFYVATKLAKMRKSFTVPTPEKYVALAMKHIGYSDAVVSPYWFHAFQGWVMDCLPESILTKQIMGMHLAIRKRGLKKDAAKKD